MAKKPTNKLQYNTHLVKLNYHNSSFSLTRNYSTTKECSFTAREEYKAIVLKRRPVGYWPLRENTNDFSEQKEHHDGTPYFHDNPDGKLNFKQDYGGFLQVEGNSGVVISSKHPVFSQPKYTKGLTVEVWVRTDTLDYSYHGGVKKDPKKRYMHFLGKGISNHHEWAFRIYSSDYDDQNEASDKFRSRLSAYIFNEKGERGAGAYFKDPIREKKWMHVVACYQPGDADTYDAHPSDPNVFPKRGVLIYKDGVLEQGPAKNTPGTLYDNQSSCDPSKNWKIYPQVTSSPVRIGTRDVPDDGLKGGLAEFAIYPKVLSEDDIREHYRAGSACFK